MENWTPNQVVAHNLHRARKARGWTQEDAARRLKPYLGELWSKATFSTAENSVKGRRIRKFTADDLVAFSLGFERPLSYFLEAPAGIHVLVGDELVDVGPWLTPSVSAQDIADVQRTLGDLAERLKPVIAAVVAQSGRGPTGPVSREEAQAILGLGLLAPQEEQEERT